MNAPGDQTMGEVPTRVDEMGGRIWFIIRMIQSDGEELGRIRSELLNLVELAYATGAEDADTAIYHAAQTGTEVTLPELDRRKLGEAIHG